MVSYVFVGFVLEPSPQCCELSLIMLLSYTESNQKPAPNTAEDSMQAGNWNFCSVSSLDSVAEVALGAMSFASEPPMAGYLPLWFLALWANFGCVVPDSDRCT